MADRLDAFSKDLARGTTRREALRRIGAAIAGAMLAATGLDRATAAPNQCAVFCSRNYPPGPSRASCKQACQRCKGRVDRLCQTAGGTICCPPDHQCCFDYATNEGACCPPDQQCCFTATGLQCCPPGQQCTFDYYTYQYVCA